MQRNQPEQLMTWETQQEVVATLNYAAINENEIKSLWKLLKQIRKKIISKIWEFAGTFNKYKPSKIICTFLKWVLIGPHNLDRDRTTQVEMVVEVAAQVVSQNMKSNRQIQYHQRNPNSCFYSRLETPLNILLGLYFYQKLVNFLPALKLGVNFL